MDAFPSSSSSSSSPRWNYDVFLSFRGEDTCKNFVDHLYMALQQKGIHTFKDDEKLQRGKSISSELLKAIKESKFAIIIFSKNYASSSWCLDELIQIIECRNKVGQTILPIFYNVDPSQVRKQKGSFAEAFAKHEENFGEEDKEKVQKWRAALVEVANLSGWDLNDVANGHEAKCIQKIVQEIIKKLKHIPLYVAKYEVGIDSRVNKVIALLNNGSKDVCTVGICGTGGIGKTTIAKVVFNRIFHQFEGCCFLSDVKEVSERHNGLTNLQQQLLNDTLMEEDIKMSNVHYGINVIKRRLRYKKVLEVLDNVDSLKQLESLVGANDWFGFGSRIIVTTRNERLLVENKVDEMYKVELLNDDESLLLFSWYAFTNNHPLEDYLELSRSVINYAQGLPLALQVLGSFLFKRSLEEWEHELDNLKRIPNKQIHDVLKISFDGLNDTEKDLFLDIACFFKWYDKDYVMDILGSNGFHPRIPILIERSLITISSYNKLCMHDLLQEMGKEIVRQESPDDPGKRSRLWFYEDIYKVFRENTVTETIKGIMLHMPHRHLQEILYVNVDVFEKMKKLKLLKLSGIRPCGHLTYISNELCYLDWDEYPAKFLPSNFHPKNLVRLRLCQNQIKEISSSIKFLEKLKYLDLGLSLNLYKTPDLSSLPYLEKLNLYGCKNLNEVHESIGVHERLVSLDLGHCRNLRSLTKSIKLEKLESLNLSGCLKLEKFPEIQGRMDRLRKLYLHETAIKGLPSSIEHLEGLQKLSVGDCRRLKRVPSNIFSRMKDLKSLRMGGTAVEQLPSSIVQLCNLSNLNLSDLQKRSPKRPNSLVPFSLVRKRTPPASTNYLQLDKLLSAFSRTLSILDLSGNNLSSLPTSLIQLKCLGYLHLKHCTSLRRLTSLPSSIYYVNAHGCKSLERYWIPPSGISPKNRQFRFTDCHKLVMDEMDEMPNISSQTQLQGIRWIVFPGSEIPQWFRHKSEVEGSSLSLVVDHLSSYNNVKGIVICAVLESDAIDSYIEFDLKINGYGVNWVEDFWRCKGNHVILTSVTKCYDEAQPRPTQSIKNLMKKRTKLSQGPPNICDDASCYIQASVFSKNCISGTRQDKKVKKMGIHLIMEEQGEGE
ncbi:disease resistance protein RUN1-like [Cornus florida]|uniref:disease resistance protein RUN1-like n=1 Tax=Cornus florida TaxID=4283 RepID=UPI0028973D41|nr:disease resistance protein RUN1-like [Cornus florida]